MSRLYEKMLHWLYEKGNASRAHTYAKRLKRILKGTGEEGTSIFAEECLSLAAEAEGDLAEAIRHRESEISLIQRAHELARGTPHEIYVFGQYSYHDLGERFVSLAALYCEIGNAQAAQIALLKSSQVQAH